MSNRPVILDTDPGIDDAVAMAVLRRLCPEQVALIVATYCNVALERTVSNALTMLSLLDWAVPVLRGAKEPTGNGYHPAQHIHGMDGLAGLGRDFPEETALAGDFPQILYGRLCAMGKADYIAIGPLTNLAVLLKRFPDAREHIGRVICMGGGIGMGNVTEWAEFNIHCDPESAAYVLRELEDIVLVPLDVTTSVSFVPEQIDAYTEGDTSFHTFMRKMLTAIYESCIRYGEPGATMHDSTAVLYYLYPELFTVQRCGIDVDCEHRVGMTLINKERKNVTLVRSADSQKLLSIIGGCI